MVQFCTCISVTPCIYNNSLQYLPLNGANKQQCLDGWVINAVQKISI